MAELQTLFHNPESLSDSDLSSIRGKLWMQGWMPWFMGTGAGAVGFLTSNRCWMRASLFFGVGLTLGASVAYRMGSSSPSGYDAEMDKEILEAFEQRYVQRSLNACGYGNNALNLAQNTHNPNPRYKKLYQ